MTARGALALALALGLLAHLALGALTTSWPMPARWALGAFGLAMLAWILTDWDDTVIALVAALALLGLGVVPVDQLYRALGSELVCLLLAGFVLAAVLQRSGLVERLTLRWLAGCRSPRALCYRLMLAVAATAFLVPSTSGRAALLLPLWLLLAARLPAPLPRALALLLPTVILLSAGASLLGAGAHLLAVELMRSQGGWRPGFLDWLLMAAPFALLSCLLATELVLRLFVPAAARAQDLTLPAPIDTPWTNEQRGTLAVLLASLAALGLSPWLGLELPLVALGAALLAACPPLTGVSWKQALQGVEWNLLLFMAATLLLGGALVDSGAAVRLAGAALGVPALALAPAPLLWAVAVAVALLSHLLITSRTARVAVLLPSVALPMAALGLDLTLLAFVLVLGSGFCQTFAVSAKPVALFSDKAQLAAGDLLRLALALLPGLTLLLWAFALGVWPPLLHLLAA